MPKDVLQHVSRRQALQLGAGATLATTAAGALSGTPALAQEEMSSQMTIEHVNPDGMHKNPAFSQGIIIPANARVLVIGGQNAVNDKGEIVGNGDIAAQTTKAVENLITVLEAAGGSLDDLVRIGLFIREDADLDAGFGAWMAQAGSKMEDPPTVTTAIVAKLAHPDYLIEIEAMAVLK